MSSKSLDMYCLQELDETDYHDTFRPTLEKWGYGSVFKKRNGDKTDGCAFFYRQSTVEVIEIRTVDYHTNAFVDRDNIGIVALLDLKQGKSRGMIKLAQLRMLLEEAESMIRRAHSEDTPFVLCGDMNALPQSMIVKYLINESVDVSTMPETYMSGQEKGKIPRGCFHNSIDTFCKAFQPTLEENKNGDDQGPETGQETENGKISPVISQPFALKSTYPIPGSRRGPSRTGHDEYWTTFHLMAKQVCDYIFYGYLRTSSLAKTSTYHGEQVRLEAVSNSRLPCSELSKSCKGLPALDFGSDHLSLVTKFRFVKEAAKQRKKAARTIE
ncbi:Protein angel 1 [Lunasporangiospora selenospora]|uniref:Protein angel 1 n=1 Tax=Lunasporangiospora selenospora TaxID=979761 RepID=A0A9P6KE69_9FUNG|nr:Protein angel 1 [Lunasporangiospora selenospora]